MSAFFEDFQWGAFALLSFVMFVFIFPARQTYKKLKGQFPKGDVVLFGSVLLRASLPLIALSVAVYGLLGSGSMSNLVASWAFGLIFLFLSCCVLLLSYVGPFYPLFSALDDAENLANDPADANQSK